MRHFFMTTLALSAFAVAPAFAGPGHGGGGMNARAGSFSSGNFGVGGNRMMMNTRAGVGGNATMTTRGSSVSAAAHAAQTSGSPGGPQVRSVARANSQGPAHASS